MDNVSRLPRLLLLALALAVLVWPIFDKERFLEWCSAIEAMPDEIWNLIWIVSGSWVATKAFRDFRAGNKRAGGSNSWGGYSSYDGDRLP